MANSERCSSPSLDEYFNKRPDLGRDVEASGNNSTKSKRIDRGFESSRSPETSSRNLSGNREIGLERDRERCQLLDRKEGEYPCANCRGGINYNACLFIRGVKK